MIGHVRSSGLFGSLPAVALAGWLCANAQLNEDVGQVRRYLSICKRAEAALAEAGDDRARRQAVAREALADIPPQLIGVEGDLPFLTYLRARLFLIAGDVAAAQTMLVPVTEGPRASPELILLRVQDSERQGGADARTWAWAALGRSLPLSAAGRIRDEQLMASPFDAEWPVVPTPEAQALKRVATAFAEMQLHQVAAKAYREAVYSAFPPPRALDSHYGRECWFSGATAELWQASGRSAALSAQRAEAADAFAKAYFSCATPQEPGIAAELEAVARGQDAPQAVQAVVSAQALKEVAELYASMRMHPRAVWALTLGDDGLDRELEPLRATYEREWSELMRQYCALREANCFLFGQKVTPQTRAADLVIPWPCEALMLPDE